MRRLFALVCVVLSLLSAGTFWAAAPSADEPKSLQDVIRAQTDPSFYEYLQGEIDRSFLPGYQVTGKTILECYNGYDFREVDKTLESCLQRANDSHKYYLIIDVDRCYVLEKVSDSKLRYVYEYYNQWEQLCTMLSESDATMEICGAMRSVTGVTCFRNYTDGVIVYIQTTEGVFVRHYGLWYEQPRGDDKPYYSVMDYTWEEFIKYTNDFDESAKKGEAHDMAGLSGYMWNLAHPRTPIQKPATPISVYVWIGIAGVVVIAGGAVGVILYRRKRRCAS